jgi:hypothetical protein
MKATYFKKVIVMMAVCAVCFSCAKKEDDIVDEYTGNEQPGQIPGFGKDGGSIAGKTFELPGGLEFAGEIMGYGEGADYETTRSAVSKIDRLAACLPTLLDEESVSTRATVKADATRGSGGLVTVLIQLKNTASSKIDVEFPAGLIFESATGKYQNGILLKRVKVTVPSGGNTYNVVLHLYCGNAERSASDASAKYLRPVVTNSELLLYLCGLVRNKKINIEENQGLLDQINYLVMVIRLQTIVWKVTDHGRLPDQSDLDYIKDLK